MLLLASKNCNYSVFILSFFFLILQSKFALFDFSAG